KLRNLGHIDFYEIHTRIAQTLQDILRDSLHLWIKPHEIVSPNQSDPDTGERRRRKRGGRGSSTN
ncbi:MAG TPA: hypothetical protein VMT24_00140, partial [Aggregatilineaceae bacterium]|nr:hypothetical protein [Aggregatilineaceae bacterium]